jgi:hypothetical protein
MLNATAEHNSWRRLRPDVFNFSDFASVHRRHNNEIKREFNGEKKIPDFLGRFQCASRTKKFKQMSGEKDHPSFLA